MRDDLSASLRPEAVDIRANLNVTQNGSTINNSLQPQLEGPSPGHGRRTQSYERVNKSYQDRGAIGPFAQPPPTMHAFQE